MFSCYFFIKCISIRLVSMIGIVSTYVLKKLLESRFREQKQITWQVLLSVFIKTKLSVFFTYNSCCLTLTQFFFCCLFLEFVSCFCIWLFLIDIVVLEIIPKIEPWEYQVSLFFWFPFYSHHNFYSVLFYLLIFFSYRTVFWNK